MALYWKAAAAVLVVLILGQAVEKKEFSLILTMIVCVMVSFLTLHFLEPVLDFLRELKALGDIRGNMLMILLKVLGISIVTEIAQMICKDSGNASLGQALQMLGTAVILFMSLPVFETVLGILRRILGEI